MKAVVPVGQRQRFSTLEIIRNWLVAFTRGFADSLRGAIELFLLDYRCLKSGTFDGKRSLSVFLLDESCTADHKRTSNVKKEKKNYHETYLYMVYTYQQLFNAKH